MEKEISENAFNPFKMTEWNEPQRCHSTKIADDGITYAWDGSVSFGPPAKIQRMYDSVGIEYNLKARSSRKQGHYEEVITRINKDYSTSYSLTPKGQVKYKGGKYVGCN